MADRLEGGDSRDKTRRAMTFGVPAPGYRLPAATRLGGLRLQVSDLSRSVEFYQQVLGLQLIGRAGPDASLGAVGSLRPLLHLHAGPGARPATRPQHVGLYHFALLLQDRRALGRLIAHLSAVGATLSSADHGVSEALYLWDPDGLGIEVYADRPRSRWRLQGDELFMTTERLDVRGLLEASGGEGWEGIPGTTVLGHMHLHVGDLERAEAFYHRALGLDKTVWSYPGALFLSAGGYHHHLGVNTWAGSALPRREEEPGLLEWEVVLPTREDAADAAASCKAAGYSVVLADEAWVVADPWGTRLRLNAV